MAEGQQNNQQLALQVRRILEHVLEEEESGAYLEALALFPHRVSQETPIIDFLRTDDYDPMAAAKRLALYWKTRKELFQSRWLRPMNQTGSGALTPEQVRLFRTGFMHVIDCATYGRMAIIDKSLLPLAVSNFQPELIMYFITAITCEQIQTEGISYMYLVNSRTPSFMLTQRPHLLQQLRNSLPAKLKRIVVAQAYEYGKEHLLDYLGFQEQRSCQVIWTPSTEYIKAGSTAETTKRIEQAGFKRECLPPELGGTLDKKSHFDDWIRVRLSLEEIMASAPPIRNFEVANRATRTRTTPNVDNATRNIATNRPIARAMMAASGTTNSRSTNSNRRIGLSLELPSGSGKSRARAGNTKVADLLQVVQRMEMENDSLRRSNRRLEAFLGQARLLVSLLATPASSVRPPS